MNETIPLFNFIQSLRNKFKQGMGDMNTEKCQTMMKDIEEDLNTSKLSCV